MKKWEHYEHTADVGIRGYGESLEEAFKNAAIALFEIMVNTERVVRREEREIKVFGEDLEDLLYSFLEELLVLHDIEGLVFSNFEVRIERADKGYLLKAKAYGEPLSRNHEPRSEVKAITYHEMEIKRLEDGTWMVQLVPDI